MTVGRFCQELFCEAGGWGCGLEFKLQLASADKLKLELQHRLDDAFDGDAVHAAEINRAFAQKARRTGRVGFQQPVVPLVARQARPGQFRRRAAERHNNRRAQRGGDMHRAGIVGEQHAAEFQQRHEFA